MTQTARRARVVHTIPGRLRIRFEEASAEAATDGLAAARVAPGVLAVETKPAARSAIVRYDPALTTEAIVLAELERAGIELIAAGTPTEAPAPSPLIAPAAGSTSTGRDSRGRFVRRNTADEPAAEEKVESSKAGARSELWEMLIGPPPKLDRRLAESVALSAVSLLAARRVGPALGGGMTLPAYFVIWFALRRMTGLGRRR